MLSFRRDCPTKFVDLQDLLGVGSFGSVYKGVLLDPKAAFNEVAVKIIAYSADELHSLGRELYFLKNLNSPYIIHYVESFLTGEELWIIMELCDAGSLLDLYQATQQTLEEEAMKGIIACSVLGLLHIHNQKSIHRDIKSGNILLSSRGKTMLSDFGVSTQLSDASTSRQTVIGTPYWMAPEILQERGYTENADVWSLGITIIECVEGQPPFFGVKPLRAMFMISSKPSPTLKEDEKWSIEMKDFVKQCVIKDPLKRPHTRDLMNHPWIEKEIQILSAHPDGSSLPILKDLVTNNWQSIVDMRIAMQEQVTTGVIFESEDMSETSNQFLMDDGSHGNNTATNNNDHNHHHTHHANGTQHSMNLSENADSVQSSNKSANSNQNHSNSPSQRTPGALPPSSEAFNKSSHKLSSTPPHHHHHPISYSPPSNKLVMNANGTTSNRIKTISEDEIFDNSTTTTTTDDENSHKFGISGSRHHSDAGIKSSTTAYSSSTRDRNSSCGDRYSLGGRNRAGSSNAGHGIHGSVIRLMVPRPMSHTVADALSPRPMSHTVADALSPQSTSPLGSARDEMTAKLPPQHRGSVIRCTPRHLQGADNRGSFIVRSSPNTNTYSSVIRNFSSNTTTTTGTATTFSSNSNRQFGGGNTNFQNLNVEAALKYFQEMVSEKHDGGLNNPLMQSRNVFFANMMAELSNSPRAGVQGALSSRSVRSDGGPTPRFDPEKMPPEQKETYTKLLDEIENEYTDNLKKLEQDYWTKKQSLYNMYDMGNDGNSG